MDAIHGAVLALDAKELLGNQTPGTSLEALTLQEQLEVIAECKTYGVREEIRVQERFEAIEKEVNAICRWFHGGKNRRAPELISVIISKLRNIFNDAKQIQEENLCIVERQKQERKSLIQRNPWSLPLNPLLWYLEFLTKSLPRFINMVILWIIAFAFIWWSIDIVFPDINIFKCNNHNFYSYLGISLQTFLSFEMPSELQINVWWLDLLFRFAQIAGFVHLGVFVSHIYNLIQGR